MVKKKHWRHKSLFTWDFHIFPQEWKKAILGNLTSHVPLTCVCGRALLGVVDCRWGILRAESPTAEGRAMETRGSDTSWKQTPVWRVQSGAIMEGSNTTWFWIWCGNDWGEICIWCYIHKRHPISRPYGRAMGCLLWGFGWKLTVLWRHCTVHVLWSIIAYVVHCSGHKSTHH